MQWNFCKAIGFICKRYCTFSNESVGFGICHSFFTKKKKSMPMDSLVKAKKRP